MSSVVVDQPSASVMPALLATLLTWCCTAAGAALVFVLPRIPRRVFAGLLAVAAVVMVVAAIGGLLLPAWERQAHLGIAGLIGLLVAVAAGVVLSRASQRILARSGDVHAPKVGRQLFAVMSLHHVPEGMAVGLAVAAASSGDASAGAAAALVVIAMASHNVLEGALVALPLRQEGATRMRAFTCGQLSGLAEVVGALLGVAAASLSEALLPWGLAGAAGAMLTVTVADLLPELRAQWRASAPSAAAM